MLKRWLEVSINIIFWLLSAWLIVSSFSIQSHEIELINGVESVRFERSSHVIILLLIVITVSLFMFYGNLLMILLLRKDINRHKIISGSVAIFFGAALLYQVIEMIPILPGRPPLPANLSWGVIIFYYAISSTYGIGKVWQHSESIRRNLVLGKKQAELNLLRSQLQPHFLFNTLNNLLAMVDQQKNPLLADALDRLSGLLRYVVYETVAGKVAVKKEIDFIRNYSELQRLRFEGNEALCTITVEGGFDQQQVEPGIFIPFIENAFKYGTQPEKESSIDISFDLSEKSIIRFSVSNPVHPEMQKISGNGSGISSSKERLKLVYPEKHALSISKNKHFKVEMEINTDESHSR